MHQIPGGRLVGLMLVVHPFPSALDAVATGLVAGIAGADGATAARLAISMLCLQFAIGSANDLADAPRDRLVQPGKPIPAGLVTARQAAAVFAVSIAAGLALAASVRAGAVALGVVGLADGLLYDFRLKGTALSWLPFAAGVALLPVFAWLGATGDLPGGFWGIVPMALLAGAILATSNALADLEVDRDAGAASVASWLGPAGAIEANGIMLATLQLIVVASSLALGAQPAALLSELAGIAAGWLGWFLAGSTRRWAGRLGWETQAVGVVLLGAAWLAVLVSSGLLPVR